jgi:hypothetical protein
MQLNCGAPWWVNGGLIFYCTVKLAVSFGFNGNAYICTLLRLLILTTAFVDRISDNMLKARVVRKLMCHRPFALGHGLCLKKWRHQAFSCSCWTIFLIGLDSWFTATCVFWTSDVQTGEVCENKLANIAVIVERSADDTGYDPHGMASAASWGDLASMVKYRTVNSVHGYHTLKLLHMLIRNQLDARKSAVKLECIYILAYFIRWVYM